MEKRTLTMEQRITAFNQVLTEKMLIRDFLEAPLPKSGKSRIVSSWIRQGLKYIEVSEQRYFFEHDLIEFFYKKQKELAT